MRRHQKGDCIYDSWNWCVYSLCRNGQSLM